MELYKIVNQLTETEFNELYVGFTDNKADKSASFLKFIRKNPENPEKEFLAEYDISPSAFYVLKSRLNQKVEEFLMHRLGDKNLDIIGRVYKANEKVFDNSRQISIGALNRLERELLRLDFPHGLMIIYKLLQNLNNFDAETYNYYNSQYKKQVAYTLAVDNANDLLMLFFRHFDNFLLSRKEEDFQAILRVIEKLENINNLYDSHRLYIYKSIVHLYGIIFLEITDEPRCELETAEVIFEKVFNILNIYEDEPVYHHIHLLFDFLRYEHSVIQKNEKAKMFFEVLEYKIEELLLGYHMNAQTSLFLHSILRHHVKNHTEKQLQYDVENYLSSIQVEIYRPTFYINYHLFLAKVSFINGDYAKSNKLLFGLRNTLSFRKYTYADLEVKFLLAIGYIIVKENELADQLMKSIQRQLRNEDDSFYPNCRTLFKILTVASGSRTNTRKKNLQTLIPQWKELNTGRYKMLESIDMEKVFLAVLEDNEV